MRRCIVAAVAADTAQRLSPTILRANLHATNAAANKKSHGTEKTRRAAAARLLHQCSILEQLSSQLVSQSANDGDPFVFLRAKLIPSLAGVGRAASLDCFVVVQLFVIWNSFSLSSIYLSLHPPTNDAARQAGKQASNGPPPRPPPPRLPLVGSNPATRKTGQGRLGDF